MEPVQKHMCLALGALFKNHAHAVICPAWLPPGRFSVQLAPSDHKRMLILLNLFFIFAHRHSLSCSNGLSLQDPYSIGNVQNLTIFGRFYHSATDCTTVRLGTMFSNIKYKILKSFYCEK